MSKAIQLKIKNFARFFSLMNIFLNYFYSEDSPLVMLFQYFYIFYEL
jgi:hypothetical protein